MESKSIYTKTAALRTKLEAMNLTTPVAEAILGTFNEYEHGTADCEDIAEGMNLSRLSKSYEKLARFISRNCPESTLTEIYWAFGSAVEANETGMTPLQIEAANDLFLAIVEEGK
jgi:hypothetical protein